MTSAREDTVRLADLLRSEHHALAEFLIALAAFDREHRWAELRYASLFDFLRRELGLSAGAAQYRKTAAELVQRYPAVEAALREGRLCLSSVVQVAKVLTPENAVEVLPRFFGLSSRDAAFVAASIRPVENPPERFTVTPLRRDAEAQPPARGPVTLESGGQFRAHEVSPPPVVVPPHDSPLRRSPVEDDRPRIRPLDAERARVNMTVSRRLLDKLSAARDALSHSHPGASEETILEVGLDLILARAARRRGLVERPRKRAPAPAPAPAPTATARSRYVPAEVRRAVWTRDGGRCVWPLEGGGVCGSTRRVELDHVHPFARGGPTTVDNCRLLCRRHQDLAAREAYGDAYMDVFTGPPAGRCSEPVALYCVTPPALPDRAPLEPAPPPGYSSAA